MFVASHPFEPFDYLRVPYEVHPQPAGRPSRVGRLRPSDAPPGAPSLHWCRTGLRGAPGYSGPFEVAGCRLAGTVSSATPEPLPYDGTWRRAWPVEDADGHEVSAVWRHDRGDVWLPFDPGAVMQLPVVGALPAAGLGGRG